MFANNPAVRVTQDSDGMIRMKEMGIPTDLLIFRIKHISFNRETQDGSYTPYEALSHILQAPDVVAFMETHGIEWPHGTGSVPGNSGAWLPKSPHISGSLDNVTVSEALDHVLKTFPGIWVYENCSRSATNKNVVHFWFFTFFNRR